MELEDAKMENAVEIEKRQREFDIQVENLISRLNKRNENMRSLDYIEMAADIELFSTVLTGISEEIQLKESVRELLVTLDKKTNKELIRGDSYRKLWTILVVEEHKVLFQKDIYGEEEARALFEIKKIEILSDFDLNEPEEPEKTLDGSERGVSVLMPNNQIIYMIEN